MLHREPQIPSQENASPNQGGAKEPPPTLPPILLEIGGEPHLSNLC